MQISNVKSALYRIHNSLIPSLNDLEYLLSVNDETELKIIFDFADCVRKEFVGDGILLRGIVEFSNVCSKNCFYCGLNKTNKKLTRYSLSKDQILASVKNLAGHGIKTVVLQSGEDISLDPFWLKEIIEEIKHSFDIAVTLSVGEKTSKEYKIFKAAGADRYLLKIEASNEKLYEMLHRGASFKNRLQCLDDLKNLGYQVGSGNMIGLKGQTPRIIAEDIVFFKKRNFDMIGIGPFIGQPNGSVNMVLKALALTRIVTKNSHMPATTALGSLDKDYRVDGLKVGANVLMPNFTPMPYRKIYEIYPGKRCVNEAVGSCAFCAENMAESINRFVDYTIGDSLKIKKSLVTTRNSW